MYFKIKKYILFVVCSIGILFFNSINTFASKEGYIASFNILRLGESKKDFVQTAKLLQGFDIVGLVEVINRDGLEEVVDE